MAFLGLDFIISSTLWLILLFSLLYYFRKKLFKFYYETSNSKSSIENIKQYLKKNHSKIKFNYKILDELLNAEQHQEIQIIEAIDNLVSQFVNYQLDTNSLHKQIAKELLWDSYTFNSKPNGTKLPPDWSQRKVVTAQRDNHICQRCGIKLKAENTQLHIIKPIADGGQYYLENLIILCRDCEKITTKQNIKYLDIKDKLNSFVK